MELNSFLCLAMLNYFSYQLIMYIDSIIYGYDTYRLFSYTCAFCKWLFAIVSMLVPMFIALRMRTQ